MTADHWPTCAGVGFETLTEMLELVVALPLKSLATAARVCVPILAVVVFHWKVYGALGISLPRLLLSRRNCTAGHANVIRRRSRYRRGPRHVAPSAGADIATVGGVVSGGGELR